MEQQNETNEIVNDEALVVADSSSSGVTGDNAGAYYGDYSQEIYQYLLQQDFGGHLEDIQKNTDKASSVLSSVLGVLIFFVFLFFTFKFIRQKGLDL